MLFVKYKDAASPPSVLMKMNSLCIRWGQSNFTLSQSPAERHISSEASIEMKHKESEEVKYIKTNENESDLIKLISLKRLFEGG